MFGTHFLSKCFQTCLEILIAAQTATNSNAGNCNTMIGFQECTHEHDLISTIVCNQKIDESHHLLEQVLHLHMRKVCEHMRTGRPSASSTTSSGEGAYKGGEIASVAPVVLLQHRQTFSTNPSASPLVCLTVMPMCA
jgi:hypothetical protein